MDNELVCNLWAIYDAGGQFVYALSGRVYCMSGSDAEKLAHLKLLSATDYVTARRFKVPDRFSISYTDGTNVKNATYINAIYDENAQLFEEVFQQLESNLPPLPNFSESGITHIPQSIPSNPLHVTTLLYENEHGDIRAIITDEDREWVARQPGGSASRTLEEEIFDRVMDDE